jgi:hypothetical protein
MPFVATLTKSSPQIGTQWRHVHRGRSGIRQHQLDLLHTTLNSTLGRRHLSHPDPAFQHRCSPKHLFDRPRKLVFFSPIHHLRSTVYALTRPWWSLTVKLWLTLPLEDGCSVIDRIGAASAQETSDPVIPPASSWSLSAGGNQYQKHSFTHPPTIF